MSALVLATPTESRVDLNDEKTKGNKLVVMTADLSGSETSSLNQEKTIALPEKIGTTWSRYLFCESFTLLNAIYSF